MKVERKIFLIDIDGVACDHAKGICERVNIEFGLTSCVGDVTIWDYDFGPITFVEAVKKYYPDANFIRSLGVHEGFVDFLRSVEDRATVEFATNRVYSWEATESWVMENFGVYKIHFVKDKTELDFDFLIEDHQDAVIKSAEMGRVSLLIERPWNRDQKTLDRLKNTENAHFISSYEQALTIFNENEV